MTELTVFIFNFLGHPEGRAYVLRMMYLLFFFFSPCILRAPSTDCPETLPHDRNLAVFYNPTPKIRGGALPQKNLGPKTLPTLTANISGTRPHIQNRKDVRTREIPHAFDEKNPVNFGPLMAWNYM